MSEKLRLLLLLCLFLGRCDVAATINWIDLHLWLSSSSCCCCCCCSGRRRRARSPCAAAVQCCPFFVRPSPGQVLSVAFVVAAGPAGRAGTPFRPATADNDDAEESEATANGGETGRSPLKRGKEGCCTRCGGRWRHLDRKMGTRPNGESSIGH
jgi:hypothetical protein